MGRYDDTLLGMIIGSGLCLAVLCAEIHSGNKALKKQSILIDPAEKKLRIICAVNDIPCDKLRVNVHLENKIPVLYISGASLQKQNNALSTCEHAYRIKHIAIEDFSDMTWSLDDGLLTVEIPLSKVSDKVKVKILK